jgi:transcriptional regulator with XRE-family HTH domain
MNNQLKIAKNIKILRLERGLSQEQLADFLSLSNSQLGNYEQGIRAIPIEVLSAASNFFHIALDALVKSDLSKVDLKGLMKIGENRMLFPILIGDNGKYESIEIVPIKASAGYLSGYGDPEFIEELPRMVLPFIGTGTHRGFQISGDSMLPVKSGTYVVGKYVEAFSEIKDGRTCIIVSREGVAYKRIYNQLKEQGVFIASSDNKLHPTFSLNPEDILEMWQFRCLISTEEYSEDEFSLENLFPAISGLSKGIEDIQKNIEILKASNQTSLS